MKPNLITSACLLALTPLAQAFIPEPPPRPAGPGGQPPEKAIISCQDQAEFSLCQVSRGNRIENGYCEFTPDRQYFACNPKSPGPRPGSGKEQEETSTEPDPTTANFSLTSPVMTDGGDLPGTYTCDGNSISPPVSWQGAPAQTTNFALLMDHQAPDGENHWYWIDYDIPAGINAIASGELLGTLGTNSVNGLNEYTPPCSQGPGDKAYTFTLYALSDHANLGDPTAADRDTLLTAIEDITLASASLTVSYTRDLDSNSGTESSTNGNISPGACQRISDSVTASGFSDVVVSCDENYAYITSDTYPDHDLMNGITGTNEQIPVPALNYAAPIKLAPQLANSPTTIDAAVGVAVNGVPIYDYSAQGELDIYNYDPNSDTLVLGQLDNCGGHAGRGDDYHYHASPNCMIEAMPDKADDTIIGWGYDGYPLYGNNNPDGSVIQNGALDVCNGQPDTSYGYRYHTSEAPPYIIQCLVGEVDTSILPRVSPLNGDNTGARANLTPPQGGVDNLSHVIGQDGSRTMSYDYRGQNYYVTYRPSTSSANCYDFEQKTVSNGGEIETGTYCR
ncbi:YHYH protein [Thalassomonas actiniarum]|nr:YHYH protein [Thalassomonas actiniarum]